jgi:hypothetical protein
MFARPVAASSCIGPSPSGSSAATSCATASRRSSARAYCRPRTNGSTRASAARPSRSAASAATVPPNRTPIAPMLVWPRSASRSTASSTSASRVGSEISPWSEWVSGLMRTTSKPPPASRLATIASRRRRFPCSGPIVGQITHAVERRSASGPARSANARPGPSRRSANSSKMPATGSS